MTPVHIHLFLNHVPIFALALALVTLLLNGFWKSQALFRFALGLMVLSALAILPVYFTGEDVEETVEHLPQVSENLIESHEDAAKTSMILVELTGAIALLCLLLNLKRKDTAKFLMALLILTAIGASASVSYTGYLGGQVRHSEIRDESSSALPAGKVEHERDDD